MEKQSKERLLKKSLRDQLPMGVNQSGSVSWKIIIATIIFIFLILLLITGVAIAGVYILNKGTENSEEQNTEGEQESGLEEESAKENSYEGWESYTSEELGLKIKYPEGWNVAQEEIGTFGPVKIYELTITSDSGSVMYIENYVEGAGMPRESQDKNLSKLELYDGTTLYRVNEKGNDLMYYYARRVQGGDYDGYLNPLVKYGDKELFYISFQLAKYDESELDNYDLIIEQIRPNE